MVVYSLYVKTHNVTGLKYLGKTSRDPFKYRGSGKYWSNHLKFHGNDCFTELLGSYSTLEDLKTQGLRYSKLWNIVESNEWANLVPEDGYGGGAVRSGKYHSFDAKQKMKLAWEKKEK